MESRLNKFITLIPNNNCALLISSSQIIGYLSNYFAFSETEREGFILLTKNNSFLISSPLHLNSFEKKSDFLVVSLSGILNTIKKIVSDNKLRIKNILIEENNLLTYEYIELSKKFNLIPTDLSDLIELKNNNEISYIKKASEISLSSLNATLPKIKPGITEKQVASILEIEIQKQAAQVSFRSIVAFGKNSAIPHHLSSDRKLKSDDIVLIDFGAKYKNYSSDITRTFAIGTESTEFNKTYETVNTAQQKAIQYIEQKLTQPSTGSLPVNIEASSVDRIARDYIISAGYPSIPHSLGHGIGLYVHESPSISPRSNDLLIEGMVFSIEPGIYLPGKFGVRIENLFTIKNKKLICLTS